LDLSHACYYQLKEHPEKNIIKMAKIESVTVVNIPEIINVGDDENDITVKIMIKFHPLDIESRMEYMLYIFVYDIHGDVDLPLIIGNWDDTNVYGISNSNHDDLLGKMSLHIQAKDPGILITQPMTLKLGGLTKNSSYYSKKLEVFATLIPAINRASKWSKPFESKIAF
jgi:hypothetical protein